MVVKYVTINGYLIETLFKGLDDVWGLGMSFVVVSTKNHLELEVSTYVGCSAFWLFLTV